MLEVAEARVVGETMSFDICLRGRFCGRLRPNTVLVVLREILLVAVDRVKRARRPALQNFIF